MQVRYIWMKENFRYAYREPAVKQKNRSSIEPGEKYDTKRGAVHTLPDPSETLLVTDDRQLAADYTKAGGCVIGLDESAADNPERAYFPEAAAVVTSKDALTEPFMRMVFCHAHNIPYEVVRTKRLLLRESTKEDSKIIQPMLRTCTDQVFSVDLTAEEISDGERFDAYIQTAYSFFGYGMWTVVCLEDDAVIGWCGLSPVIHDPGEANTSDSHGKPLTWGIELGYLIGEEYRGNEYAYEACSAVCRYAAEELGITEIGLRISEGNKASLHLAEKLGFVRTGTEDGIILFHKVYPV